jgi:hypothetical protein
MSETKLGTLPGAAVGRDAIHVAVVPLMSSSYLKPGEHVGWAYDQPGTVSDYTDKKFGVVDPFLPQEEIEPGTRVWVLLYPGSISSLRHVWSHPEFDDEPAVLTPKAEAEARLTEIAGSLGFSYDYFLERLEEPSVYCGEECYHVYEHQEQIEKDFYTVTGRKLRDFPSFRCSC